MAPKHYLLFGGEHYYAAGGWSDYIGAFTSLEVAIARGEYLINEAVDANGQLHTIPEKEIEWFHVVFDWEIVYENGQAHS